MREQLKQYFTDLSYGFVLLFGSYSKGTQNPLSDLDIGIYFGEGFDIKTLGYHTCQIRGFTG